MKRIIFQMALIWLAVQTGFAQSSFSPNPGNATLCLYTDTWALWNVSQAIGTSFPRASYETKYYLQRNGEQSARLVYKAIEGQIQSFSPIWIHADGTAIGWDINFNFLAGEVMPAETEPYLPNSLYYPVLVHCTGAGVVLMANNEHSSNEVTAPLYFLPWSYDRNVVDYRHPRLITDSTGMAFYSPRIWSSASAILSLRPPFLFLYDVGTSRLDIRRVDILRETTAALAFDGKTTVLKNANTLYAYSIGSGSLDSVSMPDESTVLCIRGNKLYCIQAHALTKSDSLNLVLQSYDFKTATWTTHKEIFRGDVNDETGLPVYMVLKDRLKLWTNARWFDLWWDR